MHGNRQGQKVCPQDSATDNSFLKKIYNFMAEEGRIKKNMLGTVICLHLVHYSTFRCFEPDKKNGKVAWL